MADRGRIVGGLLVFVGLLTLPFWYNLAAGTPGKPPELPRPVGVQACVAPVEYMRRAHMDLLMDWRDRVVRQQDRTFAAADGKTYARSLTQTCLGCHVSKADFCDRCHTYASVKVTCWECHVDPKAPRRELARRDPA